MDAKRVDRPLSAVELMASVNAQLAIEKASGNILPPKQEAGMMREFEAAAAMKAEFDGKVRKVAESLGFAEPRIPKELKGVGRVTDKIRSDNDGEPGRMKDILRATVVLDSIHDVRKTADALAKEFDAKLLWQPKDREIEAAKEDGKPVLWVKRNYLDPDAPATEKGYRDALMNVHVNGHTYEIQANVQQMLKAKEEEHPLYEEWSAMVRLVKGEKRDPTPKETTRLSELTTERQAIYASAWDKVLSLTSAKYATFSRNSASESSVASQNSEISNSRGSSESQARTFQPGSQEIGRSSQSANFVPSGNLSGNFISSTSIPEIIAQKSQEHIKTRHGQGEVKTGHAQREWDQAAEAFRQEPPEKAVQRHPELAPAYGFLRACEAKAEADGLNPQQRAIVMARVRDNAATRIERGYVPSVRIREERQIKDAGQDKPRGHDLERENLKERK
jgi:hypothetical protein